jgi:chromosome partitioning protein
MRSVIVANPKGGAGKTTLTTNIAGYLANEGRSVGICDLDRQQSALRWLGFRGAEQAPIEGHFMANNAVARLPDGSDWAVIDAPAGLQGYKLSDYLRVVDKVIIPVVPSVFDMAATEDFLGVVRNELRGRRDRIGIVAMRVAPRTRAASMLEEFLSHFDLPVLAYLRGTQNYVNVAAAGLSLFDPPRSANRRDIEQWEPILGWLDR